MQKKEEIDNMFVILKWFSFISAIGTCASLWINLHGEKSNVYIGAALGVVMFTIINYFFVKISRFRRKK